MSKNSLPVKLIVMSVLCLGVLPAVAADVTTGTVTVPPDFSLSAGDDFNPDTVANDAVLNMTSGSLTIGDGTNASIMNIIKTGNVISGGSIEIAASSQLNFGTSINLGASVSGSGSMDILLGNTVTSSGTIAQSVNTAINGTLSITGGEVNLNSTDTWAGTIDVTGGTLNLDNVSKTGILTQTSGTGTTNITGTFDLNNASDNISAGNLTIGNGTLTVSSGTIAQGANVNLTSNGDLLLTGGNVSLNSGDTWSGDISVSSGNLNLNNVSKTGTLAQTGGTTTVTGTFDLNNASDNISAGNLTIGNGTLTVSSGTIGENAVVDLTSVGNLSLTGGTVSLNSTDTWAGSVGVSGGSLNLDNVSKTGILTQTGGTTTVTGTFGLNNAADDISGGNFNIGSGPDNGQLTVSAGGIQNNAVVNLASGSTLSLTGGTVGLNSGDTWAGDITVTGGNLNLDTISKTGILTQTSGTGTTTVTGTFDLNNASDNISAGNLTIGNGTLTVSSGTIGENAVVDLTSVGNLSITGGNVSLNSTDTWSGDINVSSGNLNLNGVNKSTTASSTYNQSGGNLSLTSTTLELNPSSVITGGNTTMNGNSLLKFNNGATTNKNTITMSNSTDGVTVAGGSALELTASNISGGTFSIGESSGTTGNSVTLTDGTAIAQGATFNLYEGNTVNITQTTDPTPVLSSLSLDNTDNWSGDINVTGGTLSLSGMTKNTTSASHLTQTGGTTILDNSNLTLNSGSFMQDSYAQITNASGLTFNNGASNKIQATMTDSASNNLNVTGASALELNRATNITSGTVAVGSASDTGSTLSLTGGSITSGANINVHKDNTLNVANDAVNATQGNVTLTSSNNLWTNNVTVTEAGNINVTGGNLTLQDAQMYIYPGLTGEYSQSAGSTHLVETTGGDVPMSSQTALLLRDASVLSGGDMIIDKNAYLHLDSNNAVLDNLNSAGTIRTVSNLMENSIYGTQTSEPIQTITINSDLQVLSNQDGTAGSAKFLVDLNPRSWSVDTYNVGGNVTTQNPLLEGYTVNVDIANLVNPAYAPIDRNIAFNVFNITGDVADNVTFSASDEQRLTPIGWYKLNPTDSRGAYSYDLMSYNPEVFRGQVATVASYANQLTVNNLLFDHMSLFNQRYLANANVNKYAASEPQFSPYQYGTKDGAVWTKLYGNLEHIQMTEHLNVENNAYGALVGFDLPAISFGDGWNLVPTAYTAYNGAHQSYDLVGMWQNGGQLGLMATVYKNDFITSLLGYGGVYGNIMNVQNYKDDAFNWFAGAASKTSYNFHLTDSLIFQPNLLLSYNLYGRQNWHTGYGEMSMTSGFLNGLNIAPGVNLIWSKDTFSLYLMAQYMANIMATSNGKAGNVSLPGVGMTHSFIEYGIGGTKSFGDRFNSYLQVSVRNISRTGIVFQGGVSYKL